MELHARLIHTEAGVRVVEVRASRGEHSLGSTLAEAGTVQEAEDLAITRLLQRLRDGGRSDESTALQAPTPARRPAPAPIRPSSGRDGQGAAPAPPGPIDDQGVSGNTAIAAQKSGSPPSADVPDPSARQPSIPFGAAIEQQDHGPLGPAMGSGRSEPAAPEGARQGAAEGARESATESATQAVMAGGRFSGEARASVPTPPHQTGEEGPGAPEAPDEPTAPLRNDPEEEPPADPEDWSQELTAVDLQLRRLGWNREQEGTYLQRAFGHPSRSRLTRYNDLRAYLMALEALERGSDPAVANVPLRRSELLAQGDALLAQLGWSAEQGRSFLERELNRVSRQQLSDVQLLQFNMLLEGELMAGAASPAPTASDGAQR